MKWNDRGRKVATRPSETVEVEELFDSEEDSPDNYGNIWQLF